MVSVAPNTMKLRGQKVFVTGADGFIGSHLVEALVAAGASVRALVYYNSFNSRGWLDRIPSEILQQVEVLPGDVRDFHCMQRGCRGAHTVFHLAALIGIPFSYVSPDLYIDTNVKGTLNVLQAARLEGVQRVMHTSTSEVYGTAQMVPIPETHPLHTQSPYSASKAGADHLALSFFDSFQLPVTVMRPFNTYGPRQSTRAVIPTIICQIASGSRQLQLGATTPTRDFTFVRDLVQGMISLASSDRTVGEVVNLGSNFEISIEATANAIAELMNTSVSFVTAEERVRPEQSEVRRLWADTTKAIALTGWQPAYGGLDGFRKGLAETIAWFTDEANLRLYNAHDYTL